MHTELEYEPPSNPGPYCCAFAEVRVDKYTGQTEVLDLLCVHAVSYTHLALDHYLSLIRTYSDDGREHVKKSVSWALREIGKRDFDYQEKAVLLAHDLMENGNKAQKWIGKDALKELEKLVKAEGRSRLISSDSRMGKGEA